mgnify:CR=1 FL=1
MTKQGLGNGPGVSPFSIVFPIAKASVAFSWSNSPVDNTFCLIISFSTTCPTICCKASVADT